MPEQIGDKPLQRPDIPKPPAIHVFKTINPWFNMVWDGRKTFEWREEDRIDVNGAIVRYLERDWAILREYHVTNNPNPGNGFYGARFIVAHIGFSLRGLMGMPENKVCFSLIHPRHFKIEDETVTDAELQDWFTLKVQPVMVQPPALEFHPTEPITDVYKGRYGAMNPVYNYSRRPTPEDLALAEKMKQYPWTDPNYQILPSGGVMRRGSITDGIHPDERQQSLIPGHNQPTEYLYTGLPDLLETLQDDRPPVNMQRAAIHITAITNGHGARGIFTLAIPQWRADERIERNAAAMFSDWQQIQAGQIFYAQVDLNARNPEEMTIINIEPPGDIPPPDSHLFPHAGHPL